MNIFKKIIIHGVIALFCVLPIVALGQVDTNQPINNTSINIKILNPLKCGTTDDKCDLFALIAVLLQNVVMPIAGVLVVLYIIWAGFKYVQAQGKPGEIAKANENLKWALIGAGVLLGAAGISAVVQNTVSQLIK
jgi:hypothetical protein